MFFRVLVFIILIFLLYRVIKSMHQKRLSKNKSSRVISSFGSSEELVEDPVCGTYIPISQSYRKEIFGKTYYFCSKQCCEKFIKSESR